VTLLSICIPVFSDNPACAQSMAQAVAQMLRSPRSDFEIVIADCRSPADSNQAGLAVNSQEPRMRLINRDAGVTGQCQSWNRIIAEAKGEWITIVNEADYADPAICAVIEAMLKRVPDADALSWGRAEFIPPAERGGYEIAKISTGAKLLLPEQAVMMRRLFYWDTDAGRPDCHFSAWHGAVRRDLLERIREAFSGVYFEQAQPGIDNLCKVVMLAKRMVFWERPLSVQCAPSGFADPAEMAESEWDDGFPFTPKLGTAAATALAVETFKLRYGIELEGWEDNFIRACVLDCEYAATGEEFHARKTAYANAIAAWRGKRGLKGFKPEFKRNPKLPRFQGVRDQMLYFDMAMDDTRDAAAFYRLINAFSFPPHLLDDKLA
jgi:hypothetical protein